MAQHEIDDVEQKRRQLMRVSRKENFETGEKEREMFCRATNRLAVSSSVCALIDCRLMIVLDYSSLSDEKLLPIMVGGLLKLTFSFSALYFFFVFVSQAASVDVSPVNHLLILTD